MKTVTLYKVHNHDSLFGGYNWSLKPVHGELIDSIPYLAEIPDDFSLDETITGEMMFFREGHDLAYSLSIGRNAEGGNPYLISEDESIRLNVLGPADAE